MWAQGLTIGILIGAGILTHSARQEAAKHHTEDHSWRQLVGLSHVFVIAPTHYSYHSLLSRSGKRTLSKCAKCSPAHESITCLEPACFDPVDHYLYVYDRACMLSLANICIFERFPSGIVDRRRNAYRVCGRDNTIYERLGSTGEIACVSYALILEHLGMEVDRGATLQYIDNFSKARYRRASSIDESCWAGY